jgi:hypothetical protein
MSKPDQKKRLKEIKEKIKAIDKRMQKFKEEIKLPVVDKPETIQPATFETPFFKEVLLLFNRFVPNGLSLYILLFFKYPIRLSDIRVSTRVLRFNITVKTQNVLYNDIAREVLKKTLCTSNNLEFKSNNDLL